MIADAYIVTLKRLELEDGAVCAAGIVWPRGCLCPAEELKRHVDAGEVVVVYGAEAAQRRVREVRR